MHSSLPGRKLIDLLPPVGVGMCYFKHFKFNYILFIGDDL